MDSQRPNAWRLYGWTLVSPLLALALVSALVAVRQAVATLRCETALADVRSVEPLGEKGKGVVRVGVQYRTADGSHLFASLETSADDPTVGREGEETVVVFDPERPLRPMSYAQYEARWRSPEFVGGLAVFLLSAIGAWRLRVSLRKRLRES